MRIFKYWVKVSKELLVDHEKQVFVALGGSNISKTEAAKDGEKKLQNVQQLIDCNLDNDEDYEADIVEEIVYTLDNDNVVTRNRYGALVLNCKNIMFLDIDEYSKTLYDYFFNSSMTKKELMLNRIKRLAKKKKYEGLGFRAYETAKGFRVMVLNAHFWARSSTSKKMMKDFRTDRFYRWMCEKQNCYRARLTPKPVRVKQKSIRVRYPERSEAEERTMQQWLEEYNAKSRDFATCKLRFVWGHQPSNRVVEYHDEMTRFRSDKKLA